MDNTTQNYSNILNNILNNINKVMRYEQSGQ